MCRPEPLQLGVLRLLRRPQREGRRSAVSRSATQTGSGMAYVLRRGANGPGFVRVMTLSNPTRLVVDVQS